jgi:uncharacterized SAM-binding protein YcdF (DUF218 family)
VGAEATGDTTWGGDGPPARPRPRKRHGAVRLLRGLLMLVLLLVGLWALTVAAIHVYGQRDETRPVDAIVVLGAAQYDGRPSPVLKARLDHAVKLYRRGVARTIIMTGGVGPGDTVSEAVVGRRYALHAGVPAEAVLTERSGMTTLESMQAVSAMMKARKMDTALLVSDPFHMLRLKLLAMRLHMHVYTSPTRTSPISANPDQERRFILRESFGLPFALLERGK